MVMMAPRVRPPVGFDGESISVLAFDVRSDIEGISRGDQEYVAHLGFWNGKLYPQRDGRRRRRDDFEVPDLVDQHLVGYGKLRSHRHLLRRVREQVLFDVFLCGDAYGLAPDYVMIVRGHYVGVAQHHRYRLYAHPGFRGERAPCVPQVGHAHMGQQVALAP